MPRLAIEPLWDIVEEHLDEAEFLWEQWEHSLVAPHYTLAEVAAGPEARLLAHIDALVVNGPQVRERLLLPTLADPEAAPTRIRAAALALLHTPGTAGRDAVLAALHTQPPARPELTRALECAESGPLLPALQPLVATADADLFIHVARVLAFHSAALTEVLPRLLSSDRAVDRRLGLGLLPRIAADRQQLRGLVAALTTDEPELRNEALTSAAVYDLPQAWTRARELVADADPHAARALLLLAIRGDPADHRALLAAPADPNLRPAALWALGFLGTATAVEAALPWLADAAHARLAGEVVATITGLDLAREHLTRPPDQAEEPTEHRPEDDLPIPDPDGVLAWWRRHRFTDVQRRIAGRTRDVAALHAALRHGPMRRRGPHLLALQSLRTSARPHLELLAPSARQRRELSSPPFGPESTLHMPG